MKWSKQEYENYWHDLGWWRSSRIIGNPIFWQILVQEAGL